MLQSANFRPVVLPRASPLSLRTKGSSIHLPGIYSLPMRSLGMGRSSGSLPCSITTALRANNPSAASGNQQVFTISIMIDSGSINGQNDELVGQSLFAALSTVTQSVGCGGGGKRPGRVLS